MSVIETLSGWLMAPLFFLWQAFDRLMQRVFAAAVVVALVALVLMAWAHFYPAPKPAQALIAAPAVITSTVQPPAPTGPYWLTSR